MGGNLRKELAVVDPRLQANDSERPRGVGGAGDRRAARLSGREGDGGLAGLHRGPEGVFRKTPAEMGGEVTFHHSGMRRKAQTRNLEIPGSSLRAAPE